MTRLLAGLMLALVLFAGGTAPAFAQTDPGYTMVGSPTGHIYTWFPVTLRACQDFMLSAYQMARQGKMIDTSFACVPWPDRYARR